MSDILATANVYGLVWDPGQDPKVDQPVEVIPGSNLVVNEGLVWMMMSAFRDSPGVLTPVGRSLWAYLDNSGNEPTADQRLPVLPPSAATPPHKVIVADATINGRVIEFVSPEWSATELLANTNPVKDVLAVGLIATNAAGTPPVYINQPDSQKMINRTRFNFPVRDGLTQSLSILYRFTFRSI